jgi:hypothetical protein
MAEAEAARRRAEAAADTAQARQAEAEAEAQAFAEAIQAARDDATAATDAARQSGRRIGSPAGVMCHGAGVVDS